MKRLVLIFIWVFISLILFSTPLLALGSYENGIAAFERADYETALREFKFLVEQVTFVQFCRIIGPLLSVRKNITQ